MCGYVCVNCGRCRGENKTLAAWTCAFCGTSHDTETTICTSCGKIISPPPGTALLPAGVVSKN